MITEPCSLVGRVGHVVSPYGLTPCKETKKSIDSFQICNSWKNSTIRLDKSQTSQYPTQKVVSMLRSLDDYLHEKNVKYAWFFLERLMKQSWNLIRWEVQPATPNQKWKFQILPSFDDYLSEKNLTYQLIFTDILLKKNLAFWLVLRHI